MKHAIIPLTLFWGLLSAHSVAAEVSRWRFGGDDGHDWGDWTRVNTMMDVETAPGAIQPFELHPEENLLLRLGPWARWREPRDPSWRPGMPRIWRRTAPEQNSIDWDPRVLLDGDPYTGFAVKDYWASFMFWEYYTLDLGASAPVERFRFLPKEGVDELSGEPFRPGFAQRNYEQTGGLDSHLPSVNKEVGDYVPLPIPLAHVENNFEFEAEVRFPLQYLRLRRHRPLNDDLSTSCATPGGCPPSQPKYGTSELELYGRGFVPEATWESDVIDLGEVENLGPVLFGISRWRREENGYVEAPEARVRARVEVKSGLDSTNTVYYTYNDLGKQVETTEEDYVKLQPRVYSYQPAGEGFRGPIVEDTAGWSFWSAPLENSGDRPRLPRGRYLKVRVKLETESLWEFARVESLVVETSPLLAERIVGELAVFGQLHPDGNVAQVGAGEETEFIYEIRADFSGSQQAGFDAVRVATPSQARFLELEMGNPPDPAVPDSVVHGDQGFVVYLPRPIDSTGDGRVRLRLETTVYDAAAELLGEAFGRDDEGLPQAVEPGDATPEVGTDQLRVLARSSSLDQVLGRVSAQPPAFTPQGDGVNDLVELRYTLFSVRSTQVEVRVHSLDGRLVRRVYSGFQSAGLQTAWWDGRDDGGELVAPGLYLVRVEVDADEDRFTSLHPVVVAY